MIRLLIGITLSELGGSQKIVYNIIENLPESVYEITLLTAPDGELLNWIRNLNRTRDYKVRSVTWRCLKRDISPINDIVALTKLFLFLKREKFDIVHFHNSKMGLIGRIAAAAAGIPKVYYTVHGWGLNPETTGPLYRVLSSLEQLICRFTTGVIFVSENDMEYGIRNKWAKRESSRLIHNGIKCELPASDGKLRKSLSISKDLPVIVFTARLAEPKDPFFAVRVSEKLIRKGYDHRMLIIGQGPQFDECLKLIESLEMGNYIIMAGKREDVTEIHSESDIFCLFSRREGLPVSIIEAMACGLPVVANSVGGVPELIEHGKTGYLLDEFDEDKAAEFIAYLISKRDVRLKMGNAARIRAAEKFNLSNMVAQYRNLYEEEDLSLEI